MSTFDHVWGDKQRGGGPAFPTEVITGQNFGGEPTKSLSGGISARDYFAARAMEATVSGITAGRGVVEEKHLSGLAKMSYMVADAMLLERAK